jgi:hypothetical protein
VHPFSPYLDTISLVAVFVILSNFSRLKIPKEIIGFVFLLLFVCWNCFALYIDFGLTPALLVMILKPIRILLLLFATYNVVLNLKKSHVTRDDLNQIIAICISIHGLIMIGQLVSPNFKDTIYSMTSTGLFRSTYDYNFRMGGLSGGSGGAVLSVVQAVGLGFTLEIKKKGLFQIILKLLMAFVIILSVSICGRTGLIVLLATLGLYFFKAKPHIKLILILGFGLGLLGVYSYANLDTALGYSLRRSFDLILSSQNESLLQDNYRVYSSFLVFPRDMATWLIGSSEHLVFTQLDRRLDSDNGYVRLLWSSGLIFATFYVLPIFTFVLNTCRSKDNYSRWVFLLFLIMMILHNKEGFLYVRMLWSILLLAYYGNRILTRENLV